MGWLTRVGSQIAAARKAIESDRTAFSQTHHISEHIIKSVEAGRSVNTRYLDEFAAAVGLRIDADAVPISAPQAEDINQMLHDPWVTGLLDRLARVPMKDRPVAVNLLEQRLAEWLTGKPPGESSSGRSVQRRR